uniref:uncharacterized protein LOC105352642 n=1 Tax=Fragaria vesca subsp. vesca TaxID=101020 RepID=UPI0005CB52AF|nr:PREDICTED: uncharacterized protein LOC105352642 [Fragaria vesca subsp. vesca]
MDFRPMSDENDSPEDRRLNRIALMSLVLLISGCFLTLTLIDVVIDQVLGTEYPVFQLESAALYGLEVTGSSELTATWNITLLATNPNRKLVVGFDDVRVSVYHGSTENFVHADDEESYILGKKQLSSPFFLFTGNQTRLNFNFGVFKGTFGGDTAMEISKEKALNGSVKFGVWLVVRFRYRTEVWGKGSPGILDLYCDEGEFLFSPKTNDTGILTHQLRCDMFNG